MSQSRHDSRHSTLDVADASGCSEALWGALMDASGAPVAIVSEEGVVLHGNAALYETFGLTPEGFVGRRRAELLEPLTLSKHERSAREALATGLPTACVSFYLGRRFVSTFYPIVLAGARAVMSVCRPAPVRSDEIDALDPRELGGGGILAELTRREIQTLALLGHGLRVRDIADRFKRSAKTVENHVYALSRKLSAHSRSELVSVAISSGLAPTRALAEVQSDFDGQGVTKASA